MSATSQPRSRARQGYEQGIRRGEKNQNIPKRVPGLHLLSHACLHAADPHECWRDTGEHGEEEDDERRIPQIHAKGQCCQQSGWDTESKGHMESASEGSVYTLVEE